MIVQELVNMILYGKRQTADQYKTKDLFYYDLTFYIDLTFRTNRKINISEILNYLI